MTKFRANRIHIITQHIKHNTSVSSTLKNRWHTSKTDTKITKLLRYTVSFCKKKNTYANFKREPFIIIWIIQRERIRESLLRESCRTETNQHENFWRVYVLRLLTQKKKYNGTKTVVKWTLHIQDTCDLLSSRRWLL